MSDSLKHLRIPYPGLRPFQEADGPIFFGRQKQTAVLLRRLQKHRFVAVIGSSGSGKSSLVKAGLLPAIKRGFLIETANWIPVVIRPGRDPYQRLGDALLDLLPSAELHTTAKEFELSFRKTLRLTDSGLVNALSQLKLDSKAHLLIIVDQFEELFSFRSPLTDSDRHASRDEASAFVSTLLNAFQNQDAKIWVVITMRSDFIGNCEVFFELPEKVSQSQFLVPRLNSWQMEQAIIGPGLIQSAAFQPFTVPQELVNVIINEAGDQPDQLPLMQHALMRTWKNAVATAKAGNLPVMITEIDYDDAGGIKNALNCDAERAWRTIKDDPELSERCRQLFMLLCDVLPGGRVVRRRPRISEVMTVTGATEDQLKTILNAFQQDDRNFLLPPVSNSLNRDAALDIAHESLFRQWHQIQRWIQRESESVANYQDLVRGQTKQVEQSDYRLNQLDIERFDLWRKTEKPTEAWAKRHGGKFKLAMGFLELCKSKRKHRIWALVGFLALAAAGVVSFALVLQHKNSQLRETIELQKSRSRQLQRDADKYSRTTDPAAPVAALRLVMKSLRVYRANHSSQLLLCRLLLENRWCLPDSATLTSDIGKDKYILDATLLADNKTLVAVAQQGTLLSWNGHNLARTQLTDEGSIVPTLATTSWAGGSSKANDSSNDHPSNLSLRHPTPGSTISSGFPKITTDDASPILPTFGEASFSDDARYLITVRDGRAVNRPPLAVNNEIDGQLYFDAAGDGHYRQLQVIQLPGSKNSIHTLVWSPKNSFLVVTTIDWGKQGQVESQLFEKRGDELVSNHIFDGRQISAACFSSDGTKLFTVTPPINADAGTQSGHPAEILEWNICNDSPSRKLIPNKESYELPNYGKPNALSCNSDGTYIAATTWNGPAVLIETKTRAVKIFYSPDFNPIFRVTFSPSTIMDMHNLMVVTTSNQIGFWKATDLKPTRSRTYTLGQPWCEPIPIQGTAISKFVENGAKLVILSGGSFRAFQSARAFEIPMNETLSKWDDRSFPLAKAAPDWLLDLTAVLTGSGNESEYEFEDRASSVGDVYRQNAAKRDHTSGVYR
ncbi:MAG TPA: hypothetical protein VE860_05040, partial [Chthoniobacterales bacterium]|nr:hypothetical protein [Chthoniobacterales bacterium]